MSEKAKKEPEHRWGWTQSRNIGTGKMDQLPGTNLQKPKKEMTYLDYIRKTDSIRTRNMEYLDSLRKEGRKKYAGLRAPVTIPAESKSNYFKPPYRTPREAEKIVLLEMRMDNLLAPDNIMNPDSVKVLQDQLNKHVLGSKELELDGMYGKKTHEAVKIYQNDKKYWQGHFAIDANPLKVRELYQENLKK